MPSVSFRASLRRVLALVVVAGLVGVPAAAGLAAPAPQESGQRPTLQLSLDRALRMALENNLDISVFDYDRRIARENITTQKGNFDARIDVGIPGATAVVGQVGQTAPSVGGVGVSK